MATYKVTRKDGAQGNITADSYEHDGSGTRFFADGKIIANFGDGQIIEVIDSSIIFSAPSEDNVNE